MDTKPTQSSDYQTIRADKVQKLRRLLFFTGGAGQNSSGLTSAGAESSRASDLVGGQRMRAGRIAKPGCVSAQKGPLGIEFVSLPAGEFLMGSSIGGSDEFPIHRVTITQPFQMCRYPVTGGQWKKLMGDNPSYFALDDSLPVESVSWQDAQQFIARLNAAREDKYHYRLPTEAEWEYACRAGSAGDFAGDLDEMAWYGANSGGRPHPVGLKKPNSWGLYDMHGNVWEWVEDWYSSSYYLKSAIIDPPGPPAGTFRVIRGGGWIIYADCCRSAHRDGRWPGNRSYYVGFRLVRTLSEKPDRQSR